jgi:hypothetical protein
MASSKLKAAEERFFQEKKEHILTKVETTIKKKEAKRASRSESEAYQKWLQEKADNNKTNIEQTYSILDKIDKINDEIHAIQVKTRKKLQELQSKKSQRQAQLRKIQDKIVAENPECCSHCGAFGGHIKKFACKLYPNAIWKPDEDNDRRYLNIQGDFFDGDSDDDEFIHQLNDRFSGELTKQLIREKVKKHFDDESDQDDVSKELIKKLVPNVTDSDSDNDDY